MELSGERRVGAPRQEVWAAVNDPAFLKEVIPGCQELEQVSPTRFTAVVRVSVGPLKADFKGEVRLEDVVAPLSCRLVGEGQGGVAGFAKGSARVELAEDGEGTIVSYQVDAQIGGKLAQIGSRVVQGVAAKLTARFFDGMAMKLGAEEAAAPAA